MARVLARTGRKPHGQAMGRCLENVEPRGSVGSNPTPAATTSNPLIVPESACRPASPAADERRFSCASCGYPKGMTPGRTNAGADRLALSEARRAAKGCRRCDLWRDATQVVFGEGGVAARAMLVGEQPGDLEDVRGRPFVGRAGTLLRRVLGEVGLDEGHVYLTNAVKHFKWRPKGTRRIHHSELVGDPRLRRMVAGRARSRASRGARVPRRHGGEGAPRPKRTRRRAPWARPRDPELGAPAVVVTLHPSAVLRAGEVGTRGARSSSPISSSFAPSSTALRTARCGDVGCG